VIEVLRKHNCYSVAIGLESGSERVRKEVLLRRYSNDLLIDIANKLHNAGIKFRTYNILGLPTETEEELWETIDQNITMGTDFPRASVFTPFPDTQIVDFAIQKGYLENNFSFDKVPDTVLSHSILNKIDHNKVQNTLYFFQSAIIFPRFQNLFRKLTRLKPNVLFRAWFSIVYLHLLRKSEKKNWLSFIQFMYSYALGKA